MPMNDAFTIHGFQGTDMAVISGAWKSILMTQKTVYDCGSDSDWNNKEHLHSEQETLYLWPLTHLCDTIISNQTRSISETYNTTPEKKKREKGAKRKKKKKSWKVESVPQCQCLPGFDGAIRAQSSHLSFPSSTSSDVSDMVHLEQTILLYEQGDQDTALNPSTPVCFC